MPIRNCDRWGIAWHRNRKLDLPRFSLRPGLDCPFATPACRARCYDRVAYRQPSVQRSRTRNRHVTELPIFVPRMVERIRRKAPLIFRIHQGGDFYSKAYFERWCAICAACPGTMFYAFTKAYPYLRLERPPNFALLVSVYYDERRRRPQGAPAF